MTNNRAVPLDLPAPRAGTRADGSVTKPGQAGGHLGLVDVSARLDGEKAFDEKLKTEY